MISLAVGIAERQPPELADQKQRTGEFSSSSGFLRTLPLAEFMQGSLRVDILRKGRTMKTRWIVGLTVVFAVTSVGMAVSIDYVTVGNAGNTGELSGVGAGGSKGTDRICGAVDYEYNIGKYEVTNGQYREFLNAKAAVGDPYGLYSTDMTNMYGGIDRSGSGTVADPYAYTAKGGDTSWDRKPVNVVSWYDTIRFANWMTNGQGNGDTESGSYTITGGGPNSGTVTVPTAAQRQVWAAAEEFHVLLTSEDEWYKSAYYKGGSTDAGYWDYATQLDIAPIAEAPPGGSNSANFNGVIGNVTTVGAYSLSASPYGTFDQSGNVYEWNEWLNPQSQERGFRGGEFYYPNATHDLLAATRHNGDPSVGWSNVGFRVTEISATPPIPEPMTMLALGLGLTGLGGYVRKRRCH